MFTFSAILSAFIQPWRVQIANYFESSVCGLMVPLAVCGVMTGDVKHNAESLFLVGGGICVGVGVVLLAVLAHSVRQQVKPSPAFSHFVCHHKAAASGQARLVQLLLEQFLGESCFIDSDHLVDLGSLFDCVRSSVRNLVIYLTPETLKRPWCVGEITTAFANKKNIIVVRCSTFNSMSPLEIERLPAVLGTGGSCLIEHGISFGLAKAAIKHIQGLQAIHLAELPLASHFYALVTEIISKSSGCTSGSKKRRRDLVQDVEEMHRTLSTGSGGLFICSCNEDQDATAACFILGHLLMKFEAFGVHNGLLLMADMDVPLATMLQGVSRSAAHVVCLCSLGLLTSLSCTAVVCVAAATKKTLLPVVLPSFSFPTEDYYQSDLHVLFPETNPEDLFREIRISRDLVHESMRCLFSQIGVHFNPGASIDILRTQAREVAARFKLNKKNVVDGRTRKAKSGLMKLMTDAVTDTESLHITEEDPTFQTSTDICAALYNGGSMDDIRIRKTKYQRMTICAMGNMVEMPADDSKLEDKATATGNMREMAADDSKVGDKAKGDLPEETTVFPDMCVPGGMLG